MILLAACTQAKRGVPHQTLQLRAHNGRSPEAVHRSWKRAVEAAADVKPAADVYKGSYWRCVQRLREAVAARVHVASAGLGLILEQHRIPTYSATFVPGDFDSVPSAETADGRRRWWELLGGSDALRGMELGEQVVVVLPSTYLRLVEPDLDALVERHGADRLVVFGPTEGPAVKGGELSRAWIPTEARMAWKLGANVAALAPAVASHCLARESGALDHARIRRLAEELVADARGPVYPKRERQSLQAVRVWIREQLLGDEPPTSASAALRRFRGAGRAFEQHAFHDAFHEIVASLEADDA